MAQRDDLGGRRPETAAAGTSPTSPAGQESGGPVTQVKEQIKDLAQQAREGTADLADRAKGQVNDLVAQGRDQTSQRLSSFASALSDVAQKLEKEDTSGFGGLARRAGEQAERAAKYLKEKDLDDLVRDTQTLARRHPDLFLGGSLIAGVLVARFLKSSGERHGKSGNGGQGRQDWQPNDWRDSGSRPGQPYRASSYPVHPTQGGL